MKIMKNYIDYSNYKTDFTKNKTVQQVIDAITNTNQSLLLTGLVSTPKTEFIKLIVENNTKKHLILASTTLDAINMGEVSLESFFKIPETFFDNVDKITEEYTSDHKLFITQLELILIEGITKVSSAVLDAVNLILQKIRGNYKVFGGIQILMIGNLFGAFPKLKKKKTKQIQTRWESPYFFDAKCYNHYNIKNYDMGYIDYGRYIGEYDGSADYLDLLRKNKLKGKSLNDFNWLCSNYKGTRKTDVVVITHSRKSADKINNKQLEKLSVYREEYPFSSFAEGDTDISQFPVAPIINFRIGAKVILLQNNCMEHDRYETGTLGIITKIAPDYIDVRINKSHCFRIEKYNWIEYEYNTDSEKQEFKIVIKKQFKQYPVKLGWAIPLEESEEMRFENVHFKNKSNPTKNGEACRAYNRSIRGYSDFTMTVPFREKDCRIDSRIIEFYYENMRLRIR